MATYTDMSFENIDDFSLIENDIFINCSFKNVSFRTGLWGVPVPINVTSCSFDNVINLPSLITDSSPISLRNLRIISPLIVRGPATIEKCFIKEEVEFQQQATISQTEAPYIIKLNGGSVLKSVIGTLRSTYNTGYNNVSITSSKVNTLYVVNTGDISLYDSVINKLALSGNVTGIQLLGTTTINIYDSSGLVSIDSSSLTNQGVNSYYNPFNLGVSTKNSSIHTLEEIRTPNKHLTGYFAGSSVKILMNGIFKSQGNPTSIPKLSSTVRNCTFIACIIEALNNSHPNTGTLLENCDCSFSFFKAGSYIKIKGGVYDYVNLSSSSGVTFSSDNPIPTDSFNNVSFVGTSFSGVNLNFKTFIGCDLRGADFTGSSLSGVSFINCKLEGSGTTVPGGVNTSSVIYKGCTGVIDTSTITRYQNLLPSYKFPNVILWDNLVNPVSVNTNIPVAVKVPAGKTFFSLSASRLVDIYTYNQIIPEYFPYKVKSSSGTSFYLESPTDCIMYMALSSGSVVLSSTGTILSPSTIAATPGVSSATITWSNVSGASSYKLYRERSTNASRSSTLVGTVTSPYIDSGLTSGIAYTYTVTAVTALGESMESPRVTITPS